MPAMVRYANCRANRSPNHKDG
ncbi:hypothetical protein TNCV_1234121, partial [Trichonephila clavipes]